MAIAAPVPTDIGLLVAQHGAADVIESYHAGTLGSGMRRIVENMIRVCEATGPDARRVADDTVATCLERWAAASEAGDAHAAARHLMLASCSLAGSLLAARSAEGRGPAPQRLTGLRRSTSPGGGGPSAGCRRR